MQTTTLPIQVNGAAPSPQRPGAAQNPDAGQFSATLSREIEQRQDMAPPPAPQQKPAAPQKPEADKGPASDAKAPAPEPSKADAAKPEPKSGKAADADDAGKDDAAEHPATAQVTDMLALVASMKPLQNTVAARAAGKGADGVAPGGAAKAGADAVQMAALQAAVKALDKNGGAQPAAKDLAAQERPSNPAAAALGAAVAPDHGVSPKDSFDLHAFQQAAADQLKAHPAAAPAREALAEAAALKDPAPAAPLIAQAQPVAFEMAQAAAGVAGDRIAARVGTAAWENQMGQKIVWMAAGEEQSASLTLNPPDLGPLQVVLSVTNDQASVAFSSSQLEVRQALENALPRLREMMGESGIALGNATVDAGASDQRQAQGGEQPRGGSSARFGSGPATAEAAPRPARRTTVLGGRGAVDTFA